MIAAKDELPGIVVAVGAPGDLLASAGPQGSLTSDSTRRDGVVVGGDVGATVEAFLGGMAPAGARDGVAPADEPAASRSR